MKGQANLEFIAAAGLYLSALGAIIFFGSGGIPDFQENMKKASLNMEAREITDRMLTRPGRHNHQNGGADWENHPGDTVAFGLSRDYKEIERDKLEKLRTTEIDATGDYLNYSQFKEVSNADNQYRFIFTLYPTIETFRHFDKCSNNLGIDEPDCDGIQGNSEYDGADNIVHYGKENLYGKEYHFLVTSHSKTFDTVYASEDTDFRNSIRRQTGEDITLESTVYEIERIQNNVNNQFTDGSMIVMSNRTKTFGPPPDTASRVISFNRYANMGGEPLRVRILAW